MSNRICERCKSSVVLPWHDVKDFYKCLNCGVMGYSDKFPEKTIFHRITQSPEVLAEKLVYCAEPEHFCETADWRSVILGNVFFATRSEAIAATVAKLNEVAE